MKASEKGVWLNPSFLLSSRRIFFCSITVNFKRKDRKFRGLRWRRALDGIDFARCSCSTLMW